MRTSCSPRPRVLRDRGPVVRVNVAAGENAVCDRGQEAFGVGLAVERFLALVAGVVAPAGLPPQLAVPDLTLNAGHCRASALRAPRRQPRRAREDPAHGSRAIAS